MTLVRWGFLGAGFVATRALAPALASAPHGDLVAVAARDPGRARTVAPTARIHAGYDALLADNEVDAVYISLTNEAHLPWAARALTAGKHVLCEKPLGLSAPEVAELTSIAQRADRLLVEATWNRWHPRTARAVELLRSGALGRPTAVEAAFTFGDVPPDNYRWDPTRGGGALYDVGPYVVGAALWALDGPLGAITASTVVSSSGVDAETVARLEIGGGVADLRTSIDASEYQRLVITTERGRIEFAELAFTNWHQQSSLVIDVDGTTSTEMFEPCDAYALMVDSVSRRIAGDNDAWTLPLSESLRVAATMDAVRAACA